MKTETGTTSRDRLNKLLPIPRVLKTDDGREIKIALWETTAQVDSLLRVNIEGYITEMEPLPKSKTDQ